MFTHPLYTPIFFFLFHVSLEFQKKVYRQYYIPLQEFIGLYKIIIARDVNCFFQHSTLNEMRLRLQKRRILLFELCLTDHPDNTPFSEPYNNLNILISKNLLISATHVSVI